MDVSRLVTALLLDVVLYVITHFKFNPVFPLNNLFFPWAHEGFMSIFQLDLRRNGERVI